MFKDRLRESEAELEETDEYDDNYNYGYYRGMVDAYKEAITLMQIHEAHIKNAGE